MKVFWSWQSDHPGKISRHFVRDALESAIAELNQERDIEEPERDYSLDHDRKDVPGSPDLAATILTKIEKSDVFVADVTPVGHTKDGKALINANVAIELGYALRALSDQALLMVFNEAFGTRDDLPFDLRHKAGPIMYRLESTSSKQEIESAKRALKSEFKIHLAGMSAIVSAKGLLPFQEQEEHPLNPAQYWLDDEVLAERNRQQFKCTRERFIFIRVIPSKDSGPLSRSAALKLAEEARLRPLGSTAGGWSVQNDYGLICFDGNLEVGAINSATQLFKNREIWGFDTNLLYLHGGGRMGIPGSVHEGLIAEGLRKYVDFATAQLNVQPPLTVVLGVTHVHGNYILMPRKHYAEDLGPICEDDIVIRSTLASLDDESIDQILLTFFNAIFDAAGEERPARFNGFPGDAPGVMPKPGD